MYHKYNSSEGPILVSMEEVNKYVNICNDDKKDYMLKKTALDALVNQYRSSTNMIEVLNKVVTLNEYYSTRVNSTDLIPLAERICSIPDIDKRIFNGDLDVVEAISSNNNGDDAYTFATKYCHVHNPDAYPIYDSYVHNMLYQIQKEAPRAFWKDANGRVKKFTHAQLKDYKTFKAIIRDFVDCYGLQKYSNLEIDQFLWRAGKDKYFKKYEF